MGVVFYPFGESFSIFARPPPAPAGLLKQATMLKPALLIALVMFCTSAIAQKDLKFLDDISVESVEVNTRVQHAAAPATKAKASFASVRDFGLSRVTSSIEKATGLQFKYAMLLDIEVELINNLNLFKVIDEWYGVRYRYGGESKSGIDCSALMQIFFTALYGVALPRTAREQFGFSRRISRTELREGDLVFFNTTGGVSHVGMYLANNKFVHAASSGGVMISDLYDDYFARRFIGAGRVDEVEPAMAFSSPNP